MEVWETKEHSKGHRLSPKNKNNEPSPHINESSSQKGLFTVGPKEGSTTPETSDVFSSRFTNSCVSEAFLDSTLKNINAMKNLTLDENSQPWNWFYNEEVREKLIAEISNQDTNVVLMHTNMKLFNLVFYQNQLIFLPA